MPDGSQFQDLHLCAIDGSNMLRRAWAMAKPHLGKDGTEIGASILFGKMVMKLLRRMHEGRHPPSHGVIFFDPPREASWRREAYAGYKANRSDMDPVLAVQIPIMKDLVVAMGVATATSERHEADDLIAAYVEDAVALGGKASIVSADKDMMQLVRKGVMQINPVQDKWYNEQAVREKFGVPSDRLGDFLALAGDKVDGLPGAPGIGPVAACALIGDFSSIEDMIARSAEIENARYRKIIEDNAEGIRISRKLVDLDVSGSPRPLSWDEMRLPNMKTASVGLLSWEERNV